jgi:hypothetical protein
LGKIIMGVPAYSQARLRFCCAAWSGDLIEDQWFNKLWRCLDNTKDRNTAMISWKTTKSFCGILGILVQGPYAGAFNPLEAIAHQYLTSILTVCILPLLFWKITK